MSYCSTCMRTPGVAASVPGSTEVTDIGRTDGLMSGNEGLAIQQSGGDRRRGDTELAWRFPLQRRPGVM